LILITGASRGIGRFLFNTFRQNGWDVHGTFNQTKPEEEYSSLFSFVDVSDYSQVSKFIGKIRSQLTRIVLINCAGTNYNSFAHKVDITQWERVIKVNLVGSFNMIASLLPIMRDEGYGRIINFASVVGQVGVPGTSAYAASKTGLWGMTKSIAVENASKGITINCLNLGYFDIGMIQDVPERYRQQLKKEIPTGKFGDPQSIFNAVNFLIDTEYINGANLDLNGAFL